MHDRSCVLVVDSPTATWRSTAMIVYPQQMLNNRSASFVFAVDPSRDIGGLRITAG